MPRATPSAGRTLGLRAAYSVTRGDRDARQAERARQHEQRCPASRPASGRCGRAGSSSGSTSISPPIRTAPPIGMPSDGGGVLSGRSPPGRLSQRAASAADQAGGDRRQHQQREQEDRHDELGRRADVDSRQPRHGPGYILFRPDGHQAKQGAGDVPEPEAGARLRDPLRLPGVHLPLPEDRPAGLRDHPGRVRSRRALRRAQVVEALPLVVPRRGRVPRGGHEPDPRRSGRRRQPAPRARRGAFNVRGGIATTIVAEFQK